MTLTREFDQIIALYYSHAKYKEIPRKDQQAFLERMEKLKDALEDKAALSEEEFAVVLAAYDQVLSELRKVRAPEIDADLSIRYDRNLQDHIYDMEHDFDLLASKDPALGNLDVKFADLEIAMNRNVRGSTEGRANGGYMSQTHRQNLNLGDLADDADFLQALSADLENSNHHIFGNVSSQYADMQKALADAQEMGKQLSDLLKQPNPDATLLNSMRYGYLSVLKDMANAADKYLTYKAQDTTGRASRREQRMELARRVKAFAGNRFEKLNVVLTRDRRIGDMKKQSAEKVAKFLEMGREAFVIGAQTDTPEHADYSKKEKPQAGPDVQEDKKADQPAAGADDNSDLDISDDDLDDEPAPGRAVQEQKNTDWEVVEYVEVINPPAIRFAPRPSEDIPEMLAEVKDAAWVNKHIAELKGKNNSFEAYFENCGIGTDVTGLEKYVGTDNDARVENDVLYQELLEQALCGALLNMADNRLKKGFDIFLKTGDITPDLIKGGKRVYEAALQDLGSREKVNDAAIAKLMGRISHMDSMLDVENGLGQVQELLGNLYHGAYHKQVKGAEKLFDALQKGVDGIIALNENAEGLNVNEALENVLTAKVLEAKLKQFGEQHPDPKEISGLLVDLYQEDFDDLLDDLHEAVRTSEAFDMAAKASHENILRLLNDPRAGDQYFEMLTAMVSAKVFAEPAKEAGGPEKVQAAQKDMKPSAKSI